MGMKTCTNCKVSRSHSFFNLKRSGDHNNTCNQCLESNKYRLKPKCVHEKNKHLCVQCRGSQICEHLRIRSRCKECDIKNYIKNLILNRMIEILGYSDFDYLCCTMDEFMIHIESQFAEDMNWNNHAKLALKAKGITIEETICRFCYTNVRPLYIKDNLRKGNKNEL